MTSYQGGNALFQADARCARLRIFASPNEVSNAVDKLAPAGTIQFICSPLDTPQGLGRGIFLPRRRHAG